MAIPHDLALLYGAVLGLLIGSFLNVVIGRVPPRLMWAWRQEAREVLEEAPNGSVPNGAEPNGAPGPETNDPEPPGIVVRRSFCPRCQAPIAWYDNIPLVSYAVLRGACRHCHERISVRYPLVELAGGLAGLAAVAWWGWTPQALAMGAFFAVLIACSGIDMDEQIIPDQIILPTVWAALLWALTPWAGVSLTQAVEGAALGYMSLWTLTTGFKLLTGKIGMGNGDFKLLAAVGAVLGPSALLPVVALAAVGGCVAGGVLYVVRRRSAAFPFGPFLAGAAVVMALWGPSVLAVMSGS